VAGQGAIDLSCKLKKKENKKTEREEKRRLKRKICKDPLNCKKDGPTPGKTMFGYASAGTPKSQQSSARIRTVRGTSPGGGDEGQSTIKESGGSFQSSPERRLPEKAAPLASILRREEEQRERLGIIGGAQGPPSRGGSGEHHYLGGGGGEKKKRKGVKGVELYFTGEGQRGVNSPLEAK